MDTIQFHTADCTETLSDIFGNGGVVPVIVSGSSMMPLLRSGRDVVRLRKCVKTDLTPGRILMFTRPDGHIVLHRLIKLRPDGSLVMNGDAQKTTELVAPSSVLGTVETIERGGKPVPADAARFRMYWFLWRPTRVFRPAMIKIGSCIKRLVRGKSKTENKKAD